MRNNGEFRLKQLEYCSWSILLYKNKKVELSNYLRRLNYFTHPIKVLMYEGRSVIIIHQEEYSLQRLTYPCRSTLKTTVMLSLLSSDLSTNYCLKVGCLIDNIYSRSFFDYLHISENVGPMISVLYCSLMDFCTYNKKYNTFPLKFIGQTQGKTAITQILFVLFGWFFIILHRADSGYIWEGTVL